jgi:hypothetical protein
MQRGFKARCEKISSRYRKILHLTQTEALCVDTLASYMGVRIWQPEDVPGLEQNDIHQLCCDGKNEWSAVTIEAAGKIVIIINPTHHKTRRANDVAHELAHIILDHSKARIDIADDGLMWLKTYPKTLEDEANWLAATMLLPRDGLLKVCLENNTLESIASIFGVSTALVRMRINRTGISRQLKHKIT